MIQFALAAALGLGVPTLHIKGISLTPTVEGETVIYSHEDDSGTLHCVAGNVNAVSTKTAKDVLSTLKCKFKCTDEEETCKTIRHALSKIL